MLIAGAIVPVVLAGCDMAGGHGANPPKAAKITMAKKMAHDKMAKTVLGPSLFQISRSMPTKSDNTIAKSTKVPAACVQ